MEKQEIGEFKFDYKEPEEASYSLWVEDCAYILDKKTAQKFVDRMKESWSDLEYGMDKEEKKEEAKFVFHSQAMSSNDGKIMQFSPQDNTITFYKDGKECLYNYNEFLDCFISLVRLMQKDSGPSDLKQSF